MSIYPKSLQLQAEQFRELMAVMHGDGGQYLGNHGTQKASQDARAKYHALIIEVEALRAFAQTILPPDPDEWGDVDGFDIQEKATKHGLLSAEVRDTPCGENCSCNRNGAEFPATCYRFTELYRGTERAEGAHHEG